MSASSVSEPAALSFEVDHLRTTCLIRPSDAESYSRWRSPIPYGIVAAILDKGCRRISAASELHPPCSRARVRHRGDSIAFRALRPSRPGLRPMRIGSRQVNLNAVEAKISRFETLREEVARMVGVSRGGPVATCRVLEALGDHTLCSTDHAVPNGRGSPVVNSCGPPPRRFRSLSCCRGYHLRRHRSVVAMRRRVRVRQREPPHGNG